MCQQVPTQTPPDFTIPPSAVYQGTVNIRGLDCLWYNTTTEQGLFLNVWLTQQGALCRYVVMR